MAKNVIPPRFFKVFYSQHSSDSMLIPISYYDELPDHLPKTVILQGSSGGVWNMDVKIQVDGVYLAQGWPKYVRDNSLTDGDFLTFVYNGDRIFEVSIYRHDGCKEIGTDSELDDHKEDSVGSLSSDDTNTRSKSETNKGKSIVVVEDSSDQEDGDSQSKEDIETDSGVKIVNTIPRSMNKGKKKVEVEDNDYTEGFGDLVLEESSYSESSYSSDSDEAATYARPKAKTNPKKKGKSKSVDDGSKSVEPVKQLRASKSKPKIKNPEAYLDDPKNIYIETSMKNRKYELLINAEYVNDYHLEFLEQVEYITERGNFVAKTSIWADKRVYIKDWHIICKKIEVKKGDHILCELKRELTLVHSIKIHIVRG